MLKTLLYAVDPTFSSLSRYGTPPQSPPNQRSVRRKASITESHPWPLQRALHQSAVSSPLLVRQLRDRRRPTASASSVHSPGLGSIFNGDDRPSPGLLLGSSANMALSWVLMMRSWLTSKMMHRHSGLEYFGAPLGKGRQAAKIEDVAYKGCVLREGDELGHLNMGLVAKPFQYAPIVDLL
ncbi:uncharacterized protein [Miscanthus floridulus]|uniref:uncharacterized protein n=1 Tax=Miscanthus floridulus TaxID=154761 RepID=UPI00345B0F6F